MRLRDRHLSNLEMKEGGLPSFLQFTDASARFPAASRPVVRTPQRRGVHSSIDQML